MLRQAGIGGAILIVLLLVAPMSAPVHVGYARSDSMAPTIDSGDGYVVVNADRVEEGDIVVFWSVTNREMATHRVVDRTPDGYITKGDNNDVTDQAAGHPPVGRSAIVGKVLTVGSSPVTIPGFGAAISLVRNYRTVVFGLLLVLVAGALIRRRKRNHGPRDRRPIYRIEDVIRPLFFVGIITTVALTPLGASTFQLTYIASNDSPEGQTVPVGERVSRQVSVTVSDMPLTTYVVRGSGLTVVDERLDGSSLGLTVSIPPPEAAGPVEMQVHVYPYPAVVPEPMLERLHDVHPIAAAVASAGAIFAPLYVVYLLLLDGRKPIAHPRSRWFAWLRGD